MDTSPDFMGTGVKPQIHKNYDGKDILLNKTKNIVLSPDYFEDLLRYKGNTLITTDGTTLLGADDKAGVAEIVSAMEYLIQHPEIKHGKIRICFTPDEEVGKGAHLFDVEKFGADWAYTMDGSEIGELEYENFNAASAVVTIEGKSVHPGYAKDNMVKDQYYNMKEKIEPVIHIVKIAEKAMEQANIQPLIKAIRGGTDGSQLSYKGLPCPNIFAGGHNFHGKYEYIPLESMIKATEVIVNIAQIVGQNKSTTTKLQ